MTPKTSKRGAHKPKIVPAAIQPVTVKMWALADIATGGLFSGRNPVDCLFHTMASAYQCNWASSGFRVAAVEVEIREARPK